MEISVIEKQSLSMFCGVSHAHIAIAKIDWSSSIMCSKHFQNLRRSRWTTGNIPVATVTTIANTEAGAFLIPKCLTDFDCAALR